MKYNQIGGLQARNLLCHSSGDQKSEIKVPAGLLSSEGYEGESVLFCSPGFR